MIPMTPPIRPSFLSIFTLKQQPIFGRFRMTSTVFQFAHPERLSPFGLAWRACEIPAVLFTLFNLKTTCPSLGSLNHLNRAKNNRTVLADLEIWSDTVAAAICFDNQAWSFSFLLATTGPGWPFLMTSPQRERCDRCTRDGVMDGVQRWQRRPPTEQACLVLSRLWHSFWILVRSL